MAHEKTRIVRVYGTQKNCEEVGTARGGLYGAVLGDDSGEGHVQVRKGHVCHAEVIKLPTEGDGQPLKGDCNIRFAEMLWLHKENGSVAPGVSTLKRILQMNHLVQMLL